MSKQCDNMISSICLLQLTKGLLAECNNTSLIIVEYKLDTLFVAAGGGIMPPRGETWTLQGGRTPSIPVEVFMAVNSKGAIWTSSARSY